MTVKQLVLSLTAVTGLMAGIWTSLPLIDSLIFFEAEAAEVLDIRTRQLYETRRDLARLKAEHETDPEEIAKLKAIEQYYDEKIREIDNGESIP